MKELDAATLRSILLYAPRRGVFYWITPPSPHTELLGEEAGAPAASRYGKQYHVIKIGGVRHRRGRLAFLYMEGRWPEACIDHINGDSLDDRWMNLREATVTQNAWNHQKRSKKSSTPMGVRTLPSGRFAARIGVNRRQIALGAYDTAEEAHEVYKQAREKYFGQFA